MARYDPPDHDLDGLLSAEDDWFAWTGDEPPGPEVSGWQDEPEAEPHGPVPPDLRRRQVAVVLAVVVAAALAGAALLGVRAIGGSGGGEATRVTTAQTTAAATTPATTPSQDDDGTTTSQPTTPASAADTVPTDAVLRPGDRGDGVKALQTALLALGYSAGNADGIFGTTTEQAVTAFQKSAGLDEDGIAGAATIAAINDALATG